MPGELIGLDVSTALNSGTLAAPVYTPITLIRDESISLARTLVDVSSRATNGFRTNKPALADGTIDFTLLFVDDDAQVKLIREAFFNRTKLLIGVFFGDVTKSGATIQGLTAAAFVGDFSLDRNLEDAVVANANFTVALENTTNTAPSWVTYTVP